MPIGKKLLSLKLKRKITDKGGDDTNESDKRLRVVDSNFLQENETNNSQEENVSSTANPFNQEYRNRVPLPYYCGLINNANNCYISCVIQALRISTHFVGVVDAVYHFLSKDQVRCNQILQYRK